MSADRVIGPWALVLLSGCFGDGRGSDSVPICLDVPIAEARALRVQAVYRAGDLPPDVIADVPVDAGRACLTLRPPSTPEHRTLDAIETATALFEGRRAQPLTMNAVPVDFGAYEDLDGDGAPGPGDRLRARWSGQARARVLLWLADHAAALGQTPQSLVEEALAIAAPGGRPFAFTPPTDVDRVWDTDRLVLLAPWPQTITLPPTAPATACERIESWPRCRLTEDVEAVAAARLVDPRVPSERITAGTDGFDPVVPLPPADAPVAATVEARDCADVEGLRIAREISHVPRQSTEDCVCTVWIRTRWVIAPADDPPPWLICGGRPLQGDAARLLAEDAGVLF